MPNARALILKLLTTAESGRLSAAEAVRAGALFDISENSIRVALARLTQAGLAEIVERGAYRLGPQGRRLGAEVAGWRQTEARLTRWSGAWIAVATGGLPRSDRRVLRARERALSMLGMRELEAGLFLRPDNFRGGIESVRRRLRDLGLGADAAVFCANGFDAGRQARALRLWQEDTNPESYDAAGRRLGDWLAQANGLPLQRAARESYLLGDAAIRRILFDPMLPAPLADETARHEFIRAAIRFDEAGRRIWAAFLDGAAGSPATAMFALPG
ncbi:PaaX family transcriptional regulator C-terminal domain-containing protein [Pseudodonghicola flavimaris]|uniref:PaaX family transcriptional regulator C-terminal domain-containing protein n=1 Tax=Pseudodonghicola flavimaris TaxID=3050036 RepID=A0ABT7F8L4_9RHOB|nr:PaaX family transcriptional regulator C-terminal domain-containing protein [Pseudodonghicola flavimaris]MDK3020825.1 PaaX family transcriptional regulator C-terminal domain-containing protein [Pseudodonghicola flavimaris]